MLAEPGRTASGHTRPNWAVRATSGLPPIATELRTSRIGSFVPLAEVTRFYSITSSARTSSVGGTVIPIERAVFRFMDSLIRVGS
jgi:hypothetical protein